MRTHKQIVTGHGATKLRGDLAALGIKTSLSTTQRWAERDAIPAHYWQHIANLGLASLDELAASARPRKMPAAKRAKVRRARAPQGVAA